MVAGGLACQATYTCVFQRDLITLLVPQECVSHQLIRNERVVPSRPMDKGRGRDAPATDSHALQILNIVTS